MKPYKKLPQMNALKKLFFTLCAGILVANSMEAAIVDTLQIKSNKMNRYIETVVIIPDRAAQTPCPTLYLLHGYGGDAKSWITIKPELPEMADRDGIIVVCPNGEKSWYWDSPIRKESQFETFVSRELVRYIDAKYNTVKSRRGRAITGLSMGGHGGLWISIRHKDTFGAGGSMSGGVDIRPFPNNWDMKKQLGEMKENQKVWDSHTVITQLDKLKSGDLALIVDCGTEDFFFEVNKRLHEELLKRGIAHDYIVRPGAHNLAYWNNSIEYQWLFFHRFFEKKE